MSSRVVWAGRYAVFDELASGGMASVFLACRLGEGESPRVVAVKKMFEQFAKRPEFVTMFLDEAHIAARIRHPNVVATYEFLRVPDSLAIVMEFVLGASLDDLMRISRERQAVTPVEVTAAVIRDTLAGLHAAHETKDEHGKPFGLVHRDVSPHNILIGKDGVARIIDFGIAKAAGRLQVTDVGVMKGKLSYMAPEQIRTGAVDRRVDVYAVGVVLWEALTGRTLFRGSVEMAFFAQRSAGTVEIPPPSTVNSALSPSLDAVVLRALEADPARRFGSAREMATALDAATATASQAEVAAWVAGLAGGKIRDLEAMRNEVEASYASGELADLGGGAPALASAAAATIVGTPSFSAPAPDLLSAPAVSAPLMTEIPDLVPSRPAAKSGPSLEAPTSKRAPASRAAARAAPPPAAESYDDAFEDTGGPGVRLDLAVEEAPRSRMSSPSLSLDARGSRASFPQISSRAPTPRGGRSRSVGGVFFALLFLAGGGAAAWQFLPSFLRTSVIDAGARRGLVVAVDQVVPHGGGLTLRGVTVTLTNVKDVALKAPEVEVGVDWQGNVQKILAPGYDLTLRGSLTEVGTRLAAWRAGPHLPVALTATAGHLIWSDALVPGVQVEGIDVSLATGADGEGSAHLEAPSITVTLPRGALGPWRVDAHSSAEETKIVVALDRAKSDGPPNMTLVSRPNLGSVLSVIVPRGKLGKVGVPIDFLHSDPELDLAFESQVLPTGEPVTAHATLALFGQPGAPFGVGGGVVDVVIEGKIAGNTARPLRFDPGTITLGKNKTRLDGFVMIEHEGIHLELERSTAKPGSLALDTRDWTGPAVATPPTKLAPATSASPAPSGRHR